MTGLPTLLVELDDGTGTFPHDITAYVHMPTGWSVERGRPNEFDDVDPGQLRLRLDNVDGRFTLGAPTYPVYVDQRIRLTETIGVDDYIRHTGYVQDWPLEWPDPAATVATVRVSSIDRLSRLSRRKLRSLVENEILLDGPVSYYTLGESEGSTTAGDTSGNGNQVLTQAGAGAAVTFGAATGPEFDDLTAATFAGGKYLTSTDTSAATSISIECFFLRAGLPSVREAVIESGTSIEADTSSILLAVCLDTAGHLEVWWSHVSAPSVVFTSSDSYADGATHALVVVADAATTSITVYVDGAAIGSVVSPAAYSLVKLSVGGSRLLSGVARLTGVVSHVAAYLMALAPSRIADHAAAGLTGFAAELSHERIERLASYAGLTAADLDLTETGVLEAPTQGTAGQSPLDAMRRVTTAEGGTLFIAGDGRLTMHNRTHRVYAATGTPTLELASTDIEHDDLTISADKAYLQNTVTGSRSGGATQTVVDQTSIDTHDEYPADLSDLLVSTDDEVLARINWQVNAYSEPRARLSSVTIDLYTLPTATQKAVLATEVGDRITVSGMPTQAPFSTADLIVEAITEEQTRGSWRISYNTAPAELFHAWILGDPVHGVLGSTTRPHH